MELTEVVAISAVRTPEGRFGRTLKDMASSDLGGVSMAWIIKREHEQP